MQGPDGIRTRPLMVHLAGATVAAWGVSAALRWSDVDLDAGTIHIARSIRGSPRAARSRKAIRPRKAAVVPIVNGLWDDLLEQRQRQGASAIYVIGDGDGKTPLRLNRMDEDVRALANRKLMVAPKCACTTCAMRYASALLVAGTGRNVQVAALLGHSTPTQHSRSTLTHCPTLWSQTAVEADFRNSDWWSDHDRSRRTGSGADTGSCAHRGMSSDRGPLPVPSSGRRVTSVGRWAG